MLASKMLLNTLKEAPNEAVIDSHILLLRSGMIRKLVAGVYNYMPLGLRTLHKIENIIREEMDYAGGLEILSSALQPKELWEESGRWYKYGPELMRLKDRHEREFCLGPTHEEIFTDLVRNTVKSSKNLPINIYQIQTKYRDELRPRFGLMRGREFIMKDAYSFDVDEKGLEKSYQIMHDTYCRIFNGNFQRECECADRVCVSEEFDEVCECKGSAAVPECIEHDQDQRQCDKKHEEYGIGQSPCTSFSHCALLS